MEQLNDSQIQSFLREVGRRFPATATLLLLGGSALNLLGHPRPTLDIDYVGDDVRKNDLQRIIDQVAEAMQIDVEAVPIGQFVPLPAGADERKLFVGAYGSIDVYILDPYTIALSKLDRGFDTDIEDVVFLLHRNLITLERLETVVENALVRAVEFDMIPATVRNHLQAVRSRL